MGNSSADWLGCAAEFTKFCESPEEGLGVSGFQAGGCVKSLDPKSQGWAPGQIKIGRDLALLQGCAWAP